MRKHLPVWEPAARRELDETEDARTNDLRALGVLGLHNVVKRGVTEAATSVFAARIGITRINAAPIMGPPIGRFGQIESRHACARPIPLERYADRVARFSDQPRVCKRRHFRTRPRQRAAPRLPSITNRNTTIALTVASPVLAIGIALTARANKPVGTLLVQTESAVAITPILRPGVGIDARIIGIPTVVNRGCFSRINTNILDPRIDSAIRVQPVLRDITSRQRQQQTKSDITNHAHDEKSDHMGSSRSTPLSPSGSADCAGSRALASLSIPSSESSSENRHVGMLN
jgi:hypothetical protein